MARRLRLAAGVLIAVLALGACNGDTDDPETSTSSDTAESMEPTTTESSSSDSGSTATPPVVEEPTAPPEMAQDDTVGATATAYYFLLLFDYMRATGDTTVWDSLSAPECEWCTAMSEDARELHAEGGWIESPGMEFDITEALVNLPTPDVPHYTVLVNVVEPVFTQVNGDGTTIEGGDNHLEPMGIAVQYTNDGFRVVGVNYEEV